MRPHVVILGAGAAGMAAARVLRAADAVDVTVVARTAETPSNRTLVNKGVAIGLLTPEQTAVPGADARCDSAVRIDTPARTVTLASDAEIAYDALLVAGASAASAAGRLTTLHSLDDAVRVRDLLARHASARVIVFGAGLVAAETASLLHDRGHRVTMVARAAVPGASVFGAEIAARLAALHQSTTDTRFGRSAASFALDGDDLVITLDDGELLHADLAIIAHGTTPAAPTPFGDGVPVDAHLRAVPGVYAAGGVALLSDGGPSAWRMDHWADAAAQGEHAARVLLHDLGHGEDPGAYLPRSLYTATVHGAVIAGIGLTGATGTVVSTDPLVVVHDRLGVPSGVVGVDAVPAVIAWTPRLHDAVTPESDLVGSP